MGRGSLPAERGLYSRKPQQQQATANPSSVVKSHTYDLRSSSSELSSKAQKDQYGEAESSVSVPAVQVTRHTIRDDSFDDGDDFLGEQQFMVRSLGDDLDRIPGQFGARRRASFSMGDKGSDWCKYAQVCFIQE